MFKTTILSISTVILSIVFVTAISKTNAQMGSMMYQQSGSSEGDHSQSLESALQELLDQQNVNSVQELDLSKISDDQWETLGDAVMELYHPGEAHEQMDEMMGGEGSESLKQMHINMGKSYLDYGGYGGYGYGMMGGGYGMMGYGNSFYGYNSILSSVFYVSATIFFLAGAYFFIKKSTKK